MPRSTVRIDLPLHGQRGDLLTIAATYSEQSAALAIVFAVLDILPAGPTIIERGVQGVLDPAKLTLLHDAGYACASALDAARQAGASGWQQAVSCLQNNPDFAELVIGIWRDSVIKDGLMTAAAATKRVPSAQIVLAGQVVNRILAERFYFGLPADVTFPYRLRCPAVVGTPCPSRDVATTEPSLATTLPVATTVAPDTNQPVQTTVPNLTTPPGAIVTTSPVPEQPQIQKATIAVPGNQPWTDTGVDVAAGENLYIEGSGTIKIAGSDPGKLTNGVTVGAAPNGYCQAAQSFTAPGRQCFGMIARIGAGDPFDVLAAVSQTAHDTGRLYVGVNDDSFGDNSGTWTASIKACRGGTLEECVTG